MANRGDKVNPGDVLGQNEYAGFKAPQRADQSTILPGGNTVDRGRINKTLDNGNGARSAAKPVGEVSGSGY